MDCSELTIIPLLFQNSTRREPPEHTLTTHERGLTANRVRCASCLPVLQQPSCTFPIYVRDSRRIPLITLACPVFCLPCCADTDTTRDGCTSKPGASCVHEVSVRPWVRQAGLKPCAILYVMTVWSSSPISININRRKDSISAQVDLVPKVP